MASGKTTVGKLLANKLCLSFIDLDHFIEKKEGKSVTEIFNTKGEIYFRRIENKYLNELLNSDKDFILSLGGGTPCYANNMEAIIESNVKSIYLNASIATLTKRIAANKNKRPLVAELSDDALSEFIAKHLFERRNFYEKANFKISVDNLTIEDIVKAIWIELQLS